ncbi:hypothetical protein [Anabaena azotica]|uniref:Uncharacterized protein n=1 Tax=Anabaena azotica FACHB-119 TaxID=947527 RepID=A0ABR8D657_9NOST|nr:hypothetical protein [Anabaena azotica]MBD2502644.1 hypothetical protein [Anabaena azotica FACHB-119]
MKFISSRSASGGDRQQLHQKKRYPRIIWLFCPLAQLSSSGRQQTKSSKIPNCIANVLDFWIIFILNYAKLVGLVGFYGKRPKS